MINKESTIKKYKKYMIAVLILIVLLIIFLILRERSDQKTSITNYVKKNQVELELYVNEVLKNRPVENEKYHNYTVSYYENQVQFDVSAFGLVTNTIYKGFYYSVDGNPCGFQGTVVDFTKDGNGWKWEEMDGDNWEYTEKIMDHWFYYEIHF